MSISASSTRNYRLFIGREWVDSAVGAIVPWNFSLQLACMRIGPAPACDNGVVLKPAEATPMTALEVDRDNAMQAVENFTERNSVWIDTGSEPEPSIYG